MSEKGWIKVDRNIEKHWLWDEKPFSYGQAWIDLILIANHKDDKISYKGEVIVCKRGTVNKSITFLADRWGWSRCKARRFLLSLQSDGMVTIKATTHRTTITIENYNIYQDTRTTKQTTNKQQVANKQTASSQQVDTYKNVKNDKNEKNIYNALEEENMEDDLSPEELKKMGYIV